MMANTGHKPILIVIAGPNGSGKTSVTSRLLKHEWVEGSLYINPDIIANEVFGDCEKVKLIEPLEVFDFHNFINKSYMIMSDSGGVQEEAPSLGKPVLVLRDTTERPEGIAAGTLKLVGTDEETIYKEAKRLLTDKEEYERMSMASNPYGDGHASERIVDAIIKKESNY